MSTEKALAFDEGYDAALAGNAETDNPYSCADWRHKEWTDGFDQVLAILWPGDDNTDAV